MIDLIESDEELHDEEIDDLIGEAVTVIETLIDLEGQIDYTLDDLRRYKDRR